MNKSVDNNWSMPQGRKLTLLPPFEHKEPEDDDCGLPESPIYSNYVKYLWRARRRSGGVQVPADFGENARLTALEKS